MVTIVIVPVTVTMIPTVIATALASSAQSTLIIGIVIPVTIVMQDLKRLGLSYIDISPSLLLPMEPPENQISSS